MDNFFSAVTNLATLFSKSPEIAYDAIIEVIGAIGWLWFNLLSDAEKEWVLSVSASRRSNFSKRNLSVT